MMKLAAFHVALFLSVAGVLLDAAPRPNIGFILVDDLGSQDLGCEGGSFYGTPNVDRIGRGAMHSFHSVQGPIQTSEARWKQYRDKAERLGLTRRTEPRFMMDRTREVRQVQDHPVHAGMAEAMDEAVGLVLNAVDEAGFVPRGGWWQDRGKAAK